jgi:hypothetical protein
MKKLVELKRLLYGTIAKHWGMSDETVECIKIILQKILFTTNIASLLQRPTG